MRVEKKTDCFSRRKLGHNYESTWSSQLPNNKECEAVPKRLNDCKTMSEHDTQSHLVQHIIASFLFFGLNTFSDLLETELVALPGRRAWVGDGGSLPMGHLKQLEYGGKKLGRKIVQRQQSLQFWSRCCKRIVCDNIAAEDMRARESATLASTKETSRQCETKQGNSTHRRLCSSSHSMLENTRRSPFHPRREPYSAVLEKTTQENSKL